MRKFRCEGDCTRCEHLTDICQCEGCDEDCNECSIPLYECEYVDQRDDEE